jgi:acyl-[acyl-carrier-protein]-phospholipid O-acyltransferase/long-chain-fatty-acid--[acyl-carrier-protein] ligase
MFRVKPRGKENEIFGMVKQKPGFSFGPMKTFFFKILAYILRALLRTFGHIVYRLKIRGASHIPQQRGALLVANHASYMDFILVVSSVPRPVRFVMNADIFRKPGLKWILKGMNCIPISPRGGGNNYNDFNNAVSEQVNDGHIVVIFAEGTVTRTGQLLEFKKGVEHLSEMIQAPIIPIHFHNVQGTPFSFRGGKNQVERLAIKNLRREILVNIGAPIIGKVKAFTLRQKIKEMEVENFNEKLGNMKPLHELLNDQLNKNLSGSWNHENEIIYFNSLNKHLSELDRVLKPILINENRVGLLLPKSPSAYLIQLWLMVNKKTIVHIQPELSNEERFYVVNRAKITTLITTMDLEFSRFSPNASTIIYLEHLFEVIEKGINPFVMPKQLSSFKNQIQNLFSSNSKIDEVATIFFERRKDNDELKCVALTHRNILSILLGLRQIYFFNKGEHMMSNLPLHHSYGLVIEFLLPLLQELHLDIVKNEISSNDFISHLLDKKPSIVIATPKQLNSISELSQVKNIPFLTQIFTADLHPNHHNIQVLNERGIQVFVCAGMNETSSVFAVNLRNYSGKDIAGKQMIQENLEENTIGKPLPGIALKVCDESFSELQPDEVGSIWIKGACIAPSISEEPCCHSKLRDGWFDTKLKGSLNNKGFVRLREAS